MIRHDKEWFQANAPTRRPTCVGGYFVVDWNKRDEQLAADVFNAAMESKNLSGRARRVSISGLARELGVASQFSSHLGKLPLTRLALHAVVENRERFALRRLRRAIENFVSRRQQPTQTELAYDAGISYSTTYPTVRAAIDKGLLESRCGSQFPSVQPPELAKSLAPRPAATKFGTLFPWRFERSRGFPRKLPSKVRKFFI